nr:putative capsid protein [Picobirnavirus sp.]
MTKTAVDFTISENKLKLDEAMKALDRKLDYDKLNLDREKLAEAIRTNKVNEELRDAQVSTEQAKLIWDVLNPIKWFTGASSVASANDESWHNKLTIAYEQATKLPFSEKAGNPHYHEQNSYFKDLPGGDLLRGTSPNSGIVEVKYVPTINVVDQVIQTSELQNNVRLLWTPVRESNSGAVNNYDQSDLFQFTLASGSAFEILRLLVRPINYLNAKRKPQNVYTSWDEHVLEIMTGSRTNARFIIKHKTDIIQAINSKIRTYNSQMLPIGFDLTRRRSLLNGRMFCHTGNKDEIYIFNPTCYYVYDEANARLQSKQLDLNTLFSSIDNILDLLDEMLSPLVNGTVTSIMAGDMKKAFPKQVSYLREIPYQCKGDVYSEDEHILEALRNADVIGTVPGYGSVLDIKQGINANLDTYIYQGTIVDKRAVIECSPFNMDAISDYIQSAIGNLDDHSPYKRTSLLDVKNDSPVSYDIMAGTRFKICSETKVTLVDDSYQYEVKIKTWPTEIIQTVKAYYFVDEVNFYNNELSEITLPSNVHFGQSYDDTSFREVINCYGRFHYLPQAYNYILHDNVDEFTTVIDLKHSLYNYREMEDLEILHLHVASFGSLISIKMDDKKELE